uniref:Selenocysteine lyase isoform X1 n=1 Tax=Sus scrofa TaxID=9823 RepID=A0A480HB23_PIG
MPPSRQGPERPPSRGAWAGLKGFQSTWCHRAAVTVTVPQGYLHLCPSAPVGSVCPAGPPPLRGEGAQPTRGGTAARLLRAQPWALGLALQPGHGLLQVLHHKVHLGPGGAAAHAEPDGVPGHVEGNAEAQQHRGWPVSEVRVARSPHAGHQRPALSQHRAALELGAQDGEVTGVGQSLCAWKLAVQMDSFTEFRRQPLLQVVADGFHVRLVSLAVLRHQLSRLSKAGDHRGVLCPWPEIPLLSTSKQHGVQRGELPEPSDVQCSDPGAIELVAHDGQEVHAQVPHVHAPLPQGLRGVRVQEQHRQPAGRPLLVQGSDSPADVRHRHDHAGLVIGQHDGHQACGRAHSRQDVLSLDLPAHLGHGDKGDLGLSFLHQVLQGQADGVVLHGAGDEVGQGPRHGARMLGRVPL